MEKNIILGIDGGCFEFIQPLIEKGYLLNFEKILRQGFFAPLQVTIPPVTIPSWPCLFSGLTPEQLGFYWFEHPTKGLFNSSVWRDKSIFTILKVKQFILNVPGTFPAWKINGEMISGMLSPTINCYPPELKFFLNKDWIIDGNTIQNCFKAFEMKSTLFLKKFNENFNLMTYIIRLPDSLSHHSHLPRHLLESYLDLGYKRIDNFIGKILSKKITNLFILSDHGLKFYDQEFSMRRWLEKKGLLYINKSKKKKIYSIIGKLYDGFRDKIKINYETFSKIKKNIIKNMIDDSISLENKIKGSGVMSFFGNTGGIFLNESDKKKTNLIIEKMRKEKRIKALELKDEEGFPDIIVILNEKYLFSHEPSYFVIRGRNTINHSQKGIFLAWGQNIQKGSLPLVDYKDISPTFLKLFNESIPSYLTGKSLKNILLQ